MVDRKYDKVVQVDIGFNDVAPANYTTITNVVYFAEQVMSPDGDLVEQLSMINSWNPEGVHQNHKYWELELCLDTNWYIDNANPEEYWAYYQQTETGVAASRAIKENAANSTIQHFVVHVREHDGTYTTLTYADSDTNVLWCTGETSEFSNETGERHQKVAFKFICLQNRVDAVGAAPAVNAGEGSGKVKRINNVREGGVDAVNILRFKEDFVMRMTPQFVPNTYQGVGMKQDEKYRVITVTVDSETEIFDNMISITGAQAIATVDFLADFQMDDAAGTVETWTYTPVADVYMSNRREGRIEDNATRSTIEYEFLMMGSKGITQV